MRAALFGFLVFAAATASLAGCGDALGLGDPQILSDSITLAAPTGPSAQVSAFDLSNFHAPRRPELPAEALAWDFQLRQQGAQFFLAPVPQVDRFRGAGIRLSDRDIEQVREAPRDRAGYTRELFPINVGQTYYLQSRQTRSLCVKYGALKVVSVDPAAGTARLVVKSNQSGCDDDRLTAD